MAKLEFIKMHGCGNDYIYRRRDRQRAPPIPASFGQDSRIGVSASAATASSCCRPSTQADVRMEMYNADGSRGEMCGNGIRCLARLAYESGIARKNPIDGRDRLRHQDRRAHVQWRQGGWRDGRYGRADSRRPRNPGRRRRQDYRLSARGRRPQREDHRGLDGQSALRRVRQRRKHLGARRLRIRAAGTRSSSITRFFRSASTPNSSCRCRAIV